MNQKYTLIERWKIIWTGVGGAALLSLGLWMAVDSATQHDYNPFKEQPKYLLGAAFFVVGVGFLLSAIGAWKGMKQREAARQDYLSHPENLEHLLAWRKRHPTQDWYEWLEDMFEGRKPEERVYVGNFPRQRKRASDSDNDSGGGLALFGLFLIGMSIYCFNHSFNILGGIVSLILGMILLIGGVQGMMREYRRREREWKEWNDWKNRTDFPSKKIDNSPKT